MAYMCYKCYNDYWVLIYRFLYLFVCILIMIWILMYKKGGGGKVKKIVLVLLLLIIVVFTYLAYINNNRVILVSQYSDFYELDNYDNTKNTLKLLTYNIQHGVGTDGRLDLDRVAQVIEQSGADVIGLNEVDFALKRSGFKNQVRYLAKTLNMNYAFGASVKRITGSYGNAILSKYPIKTIENYILPALKEENSEKRSLLMAEIEIPNKRQESFYIMSTHLSLNKEERSEQIKWIDNFLSNHTDPYVLMGDFNTDFEEVIYTVKDINDASDKLMPLLKGVKTFPSLNPSKGIDLYFSASQLEVIRGYSIESDASDHLPVYLELKVS